MAERESDRGDPGAALAARARQVAVLRAHLADAVARAEVAVAKAGSHAREAGGQRERAERAEREALAQRARADALEVDLKRAEAALVRLRGHPVVRAGASVRRLWRRGS
jgi:hypothetical protein